MNKDLIKAVLIRTAKTWCQTFVGAVGGTATMLSDVNWGVVFSTATLAAVLCFVWNIGTGLPEVKLADTLYALDNDIDEDDDEVTVYGEEGDE